MPPGGAGRSMPPSGQVLAARARWFLAQAHLLRDETEEALPLLEELSRTPAFARDASRQLHLLSGS